jgi:hypothetical protein
MAILSYLGVLKLLGESIGGRPLLFLGFFCVVSALQFLTTGVVAELLIRIYFTRDLPARPYYAAPELVAVQAAQSGAAWHMPQVAAASVL